MKVLDATFLIDYLDGHEATREFYEENGGAETHSLDRLLRDSRGDGPH